MADPTTMIQGISLIVAGSIMLGALMLMYPVQLIFVHTLIESPFETGGAHDSGNYAPAPIKDDFEIPNENEEDLGVNARINPRRTIDEASERLAIDTMHTRSLASAWRNLSTYGLLGLFRGFSAQVIYTCVYEALFVLFGGLHPIMQLLNRIQSGDPAQVKFQFSPILMVTMIALKVIMIPMNLVVLRQVIGRPDSTTWFGHLKAIFSVVGIKAMTPIILPQVLKSGVPLLLQNLNTFLHFLYLQETVVEPGWYAFFAILEFLWQLFSIIFIVAPLNAVLFRAQCSVIAHLPKFDALVAYPISYISPLAELKQIVEEEMHISGKWYGRYWRSFKVIAISSIVLFVILVLSIIPPIITGAIKMQK